MFFFFKAYLSKLSFANYMILDLLNYPFSFLFEILYCKPSSIIVITHFLFFFYKIKKLRSININFLFLFFIFCILFASLTCTLLTIKSSLKNSNFNRKNLLLLSKQNTFEVLHLFFVQSHLNNASYYFQ